MPPPPKHFAKVPDSYLWLACVTQNVGLFLTMPDTELNCTWPALTTSDVIRSNPQLAK